MVMLQSCSVSHGWLLPGPIPPLSELLCSQHSSGQRTTTIRRGSGNAHDHQRVFPPAARRQRFRHVFHPIVNHLQHSAEVAALMLLRRLRLAGRWTVVGVVRGVGGGDTLPGGRGRVGAMPADTLSAVGTRPIRSEAVRTHTACQVRWMYSGLLAAPAARICPTARSANKFVE